jgi:Protein of unknown function (DUF3558)
MRDRIPQQLPLLSLCAVALLAGCSKSEKNDSVSASPLPTANSKTTQSSAAPAKTDAFTGTDACTLLTREEVQAVQGEPFQESIKSGKTGLGLSVSQCYFQLPQAVNSIVVTLTKKAEGPGARDPEENWKEMFHREKASEEKEERSAKKEEREEGEKEPEKVEGIGDEAFWTGNRVGGALYVLKGNSFIRISVGGAGDQADKTRKSKILAQHILGRL